MERHRPEPGPERTAPGVLLELPALPHVRQDLVDDIGRCVGSDHPANELDHLRAVPTDALAPRRVVPLEAAARQRDILRDRHGPGSPTRTKAAQARASICAARAESWARRRATAGACPARSSR